MKRKSRFAAQAQSHRKMAGMSPADVAAAMRERGHDSWTEHSVVGVENDRRDINGYELNALAQVLGTTRDELLPSDSLRSEVGGYLTPVAA